MSKVYEALEHAYAERELVLKLEKAPSIEKVEPTIFTGPQFFLHTID